MIAKEKEAYSGDDERARYGHRQEEDVAFHLRRAFGDDPEVVIFNDLRLKHGEENAQIDHLVMHPFGFIITNLRLLKYTMTMLWITLYVVW